MEALQDTYGTATDAQIIQYKVTWRWDEN